MTTDGLEKLDVWRKARDFAVRIYREALPLLPVEEKWGLAQQIRRSAQSIPANIAEGYGRFYYQDNIRFCYIARGSLEETLSHLSLASKTSHLSEEVYLSLIKDGNALDQLINGYIAYLKRSRIGANEPGAPVSTREETADYTVNEPELPDSTVLGSQFSNLDANP